MNGHLKKNTEFKRVHEKRAQKLSKWLFLHNIKKYQIDVKSKNWP